MSCVILGGGISGLAAAFYLRTFGFKSRIILIEGSNRLGGWIKSEKNINNNIFESGPRSLRVTGNAGSNTLQLAEWLNLDEQITAIPATHPAAKNRMIKVNGKLHTLPNSLKSLLKKIPPFSKPILFNILKETRVPSLCNNDESFYSFIQRRFGSEVADYLIDPMCRGIFAGSARDLSASAVSRRLQELEKHNGSVVKGMLSNLGFGELRDHSLYGTLKSKSLKNKWVAWSLKGGLQTLVEALVSFLKNNNVEIVMNEMVRTVRYDNEKMVVVTNNNEYSCDKVISCLPANCLKETVREWNPHLYSILNDIPFVDVAVVNLEYSGNIITKPGFGYLVPSKEENKVLGVIYDSCLFPVENKTSFTVMMGGWWYKKYFGDSEDHNEFLDIAHNEIRETFGHKLEPDCYKVSLLKKCIPQYTVGHFERIENAKRLLANYPLYLAGNSYEGVGINDAIYNVKKSIILNFNLK